MMQKNIYEGIMSANLTNLVTDTCVDSRNSVKCISINPKKTTHCNQTTNNQRWRKYVLKAAVPGMGIYPRRMKTCLYKNLKKKKPYTHMFLAALLIGTKNCRKVNVLQPVKWINKARVHLCSGLLHSGRNWMPAQSARVSGAWCPVQEARLKRFHTVEFFLSDILGKAEL